MMSRDFAILVLAAFPVVNFLVLAIVLWKMRQVDNTIAGLRKTLDDRAPIIRKMERALNEVT